MANSSFNPTTFLKTLPNLPGIYQMYDAEQKLIYVGKALNLKKRVSSYFAKTQDHPKTLSLVSQIADIQVIVTETDAEALLLENNLIKKFKPRYNILFRDDKSYPYIFIGQEHAFPRVDFFRGAKTKKGHYYGPYPNSYAVRESIQFIQKLFKIRNCSDHFFQNRSRPCLQFQINRCNAPCVGRITQAEYQHQIDRARLFLEGKNQDLLQDLIRDMEQYSQKMQYEKAAEVRDLIANLRQVLEQQRVMGANEEVDVIALAIQDRLIAISVLFFRQGRLIGSQAYFPQSGEDGSSAEEVLTSFISQRYLNQNQDCYVPKEIYVSSPLSEQSWLEQLLSQSSQHSVKLKCPQRGEARRWLDIASQNAQTELKRRYQQQDFYIERFKQLETALDLENVQRIECYDISHSSGEATTASCVVFNRHGAYKQGYRRYKINGIQAGDDYAAMKQVLKRRFRQGIQSSHIPDILLIDGGKGQVTMAIEALAEVELAHVYILGIAKGTTRKAGMETLIVAQENRELVLPEDSPALHLLQQVRDEAHRFAITGHRKQRDSKRRISILESIEGIGRKRRLDLLNHFGGLESIKNASVEQIASVPGVSYSLAQKIYEFFHAQ